MEGCFLPCVSHRRTEAASLERERTKHRKSRKRHTEKEGSQVSQSHWFLVLVAMKVYSPNLLLWGAKLADGSSCFPSGCTTTLASKPPSYRLLPDNDCTEQDWNTGHSHKTGDSSAWKLVQRLDLPKTFLELHCSLRLFLPNCVSFLFSSTCARHASWSKGPSSLLQLPSLLLLWAFPPLNSCTTNLMLVTASQRNWTNTLHLISSWCLIILLLLYSYSP